ncbi:MAG: hypothetical protein Q7T51_03435 [Candidatus Moranbacteria bacterium]|nr:hypothetical protein [Candidatus Moranbacteria bacterium]
MSLSYFIELFRIAGKPAITGGMFYASLIYDSNVSKLITEIRKIKAAVYFDEIIVDGSEILDTNPLPETWSKIQFTLKLPVDSSRRFYQSIEDLINWPKTSRGELPEEFYIVDHDYCSGEEPIPAKLEKLLSICKLIKSLSCLANYHDEKAESGYYKLVFIQSNDTQYLPATVIETKISKEILEFSTPDIRLVQGLCSETAKTDPHYNLQIGVFSVSITDFMSKSPGNGQSFSFLIQNWKDFLEIYQQNLSTYLSGFSFHKAKKEVAETELKMAEQFSKVISDITIKLFSIPVSFAGVIIIAKPVNVIESSLVEIGLILAAYLIDCTVDNQQRQLSCISDAKNIVLNSFEGKKASYPDELKVAVKGMKTKLDEGERKLRRSLISFRVLSWLPPIAGMVPHIYYHFLS